MAIPKETDLVRYKNTKLTGENWNDNLKKNVDWLTDGTADFNINSITTTEDVNAGGDIKATGTITGNKFIGDGSELSNVAGWRKNFIINGLCQIKNYNNFTLVKDTYEQVVDRFYGMSTGTNVSAGTLTQTSSSNCGSTGYAIKFSGVTITGTGINYIKYWMYSKDAVQFKNKIGSFSCQTYHDVGVSVPYTIYINKANTYDDFSSVTEITNNGGSGVSTATATQLKFENISLGNCSTGIEILIKVECGAITLKNFEFTEFQFELNDVVSEFEYRTYEEENALNNYNYMGILNIVSKPPQIKNADIYFNTNNNIRYSFGKTGYLNLSGANFVPVESDYNYLLYNSNILQNGNLAASQQFSAPINLANGATLMTANIYYFMNLTSGSITVALYSRNISSRSPSYIAGITLTSNSSSIQSTNLSFTPFIINNTQNIYYAIVSITSTGTVNDTQFCNLIFSYLIDQPLA